MLIKFLRKLGLVLFIPTLVLFFFLLNGHNLVFQDFK